MNWNHRADRRLVTGKSGSGKTTFFLSILARSRARWVFCFDPEREIAHKLAWPVCIDPPQLNAAVARRGPVCFDPSPLFPGNRPDGFAFFCRYVMEVCRVLNGPKLLAVDEMQNVTDPGPGGIPQAFSEIIDEGRRHEIDCLFIAQTVNRVNDRVRAQLTEITTFCHTDRLALAWLEQDGFPAADVAGLPVPGGYITRNLLTGQTTRHGQGRARPAEPFRRPRLVASPPSRDPKTGRFLPAA